MYHNGGTKTCFVGEYTALEAPGDGLHDDITANTAAGCLEGKCILDLYCGAGTIGLSMCDNAKQVIGVEIVEQAVEDAKINAVENGAKNISFILDDASGAAEKLSKQGVKADVVIVDPPRKGCSVELLETIENKISPKKLVYISCDPATLARDCKHLTQNGYNIVSATVADLFPRTTHVESCVLLNRNNE